jgi:hypothetical protein
MAASCPSPSPTRKVWGFEVVRMSGGSRNNDGPVGAKYHHVFSHVRYEHFVAGIAGGAVSSLVLQPLDLIKESPMLSSR